MINFDELFKNHQATRIDCGSLSIITYKKPDSFENGLRYIFDNELSTLTITGDWLKAVAVNVNNMGSPDRLYNSAYRDHTKHFGKCLYGDYKLDYNIGYLNSKIVTKDESNSYDVFDFDNVEEHIKSVLGLEMFESYELDDKESHVIEVLTQSIIEIHNDRIYICEESLENYVTDDDMSEIEDIIDEYDVSFERLLHVTPPVNDALVVAFEGFKRAYEELTRKDTE